MTTDLLPTFRLWLTQKHYSDSTVRNYLVDAGKYVDFATQNSPSKLTDEIHFFSPALLTSYIQYLSTQNNSSRYLASLNLFCQFAVNQNYISQNPLASIRHKLDQSHPKSTVDDLMTAFHNYLTQHHHTPATIKNYQSDLDSYFSWLETADQNQ